MICFFGVRFLRKSSSSFSVMTFRYSFLRLIFVSRTFDAAHIFSNDRIVYIETVDIEKVDIETTEKICRLLQLQIHCSL